MARAVFFGLGSDGTVGANKNSVKILGEDADAWVQAYFVYDSKKSGAVTVSHLRVSPRPIRSAYLIRRAGFVACHQFGLLDRRDVLDSACEGASVLLNAPYGAGRALGPAPARGPGAGHRAPGPDLRDRRRSDRARRGLEGPDQHDHADLPLRARRGPSPRGGRREDQEGDRADVRQARPRGPQAQFRGGRPNARGPLRDRSARGGHVGARPPSGRPRGRSGFRKARDGPDRRRPRRRASGLRLPRRRHVADRDRAVGEAQHRHRDPGLGALALHPVQQVRARLPARRDPRQGLRAGARRDRPGDVQVRRLPRRRLRGLPLHDPGRPGGLHGLLAVRRILSGQGQGQSPAEGHRHGSAGAAPRGRARELRLLPGPSGSRPLAPAADGRQGLPVRSSPLRVLGRMRGLRRNALPQARQPALRRPRARGERHRLHVDLRRQPSDDAVDGRPGRPRTRMVQLSLRGQRRVRTRDAPRPGRPRRAGADSARRAGGLHRKRSRGRDPRSRPVD